jgi:hypothetical protein
VLIDFVDSNNLIIEWIDFIHSSMKHCWKLQSTFAKIENALVDIKGKKYSIEVMKKLKELCE